MNIKIISFSKVFVQKIRNLFRHIINQILLEIENMTISPVILGSVFAAMVALRIFIEKVAKNFGSETIEYLITFYFQNFLFFAITFLLIWLWISFLLKINPAKLTGLFLWGSWLIILPPILDLIQTGGQLHWSFYLINDLKGLWRNFYTIFGNLPPAVVYFGTKISFLAAVVLTSLFVYLKSKNFFKSLLNGVVVYAIFFLMGSFPSWFSLFYYPLAEGRHVFDVSESKIVGLFMTPAQIFAISHNSIANVLSFKLNLIYFCLFFLLLAILLQKIDRQRLRSFLQANFSILPFFCAVVVLIAFMKLGSRIYPHNFQVNVFAFFGFFSVLIAVFSASLIGIFFYARNKSRLDDISVDKNLSVFLPILIFFSLTGPLLVDPKLFFIFLIYFIVLFLFSCRSFKMFARFFLAEELFLSLILFLLMFAGFIFLSDNQNFTHFPWKIGIILAAASALFTSGKKIFYSSKTASDARRLATASGLFLFYPFSSYVLNESTLFWLSFFLSSFSFWLTIRRGDFIKISPAYWLVAIFLLYLLLITRLVFGIF